MTTDPTDPLNGERPPEVEEPQPCDGCGHPEHPARECPVTRYGERCECDEPVTQEAPATDPLDANRQSDNPRLAILSRLNTPPYDEASGTYSTPLGEGAGLLDAYRAAVLRDVLWRLGQSSGDAAAAKLVEDNPDLAELLNATEG